MFLTFKRFLNLLQLATLPATIMEKGPPMAGLFLFITKGGSPCLAAEKLFKSKAVSPRLDQDQVCFIKPCYVLQDDCHIADPVPIHIDHQIAMTANHLENHIV